VGHPHPSSPEDGGGVRAAPVLSLPVFGEVRWGAANAMQMLLSAILKEQGYACNGGL
jgi:hypothetical protein